VLWLAPCAHQLQKCSQLLLQSEKRSSPRRSRARSLGYEPVGYDSSEAALLAFEADPQRFDAVLSDEMLPGMAGSEFAFKVCARRPELPIVLMSGNVSAALEARARAAGVQAVLHKPLALQELAECLSMLVSAKSRDRQAVDGSTCSLG